MPQTAEQLQAARELARAFGLNGADFYQHKQSKSFLISRTGIEKIQYKAGIEVGFEAVRVEPEFAAVKALASRKVKAEGKATATKLSIQTFGSACKLNCQVSYYLEMAEKRALSRAVLKLTDFYQLGVYGEDEMPPSVVRSAEEMSDIGTGASVVAEAPKKPVAEASAPASALPAPSTGYNLSSAEVRQQLGAMRSKLDLIDLWNKLTAGQQAEFKEQFTTARAHIDATIAQAAATAVRQAPAAMKVAGDSTGLVDEFTEHPITPSAGPAVHYATVKQRDEITRLLNNPLVTRKEKTALLLKINQLDSDRAKAAILKLRKAIGEREGIDPLVGARMSLKSFVLRNKLTLSAGRAEQLMLIADLPEATLESLLDTLDEAENALIDDRAYGTDAELEEAENAIAA
jgi:hypothetical protein